VQTRSHPGTERHRRRDRKVPAALCSISFEPNVDKGKHKTGMFIPYKYGLRKLEKLFKGVIISKVRAKQVLASSGDLNP
jgi:hypothetical protein